MKNLLPGFVICISLAACGGGGGGGGGSVTPPAGGGGASSPTTASFVVAPGSSSTIMSVGPQYISTATAAISISVNNSPPTTLSCASTCTGTLTVSPGSNTFSIAALDSQLVALSKTSLVIDCPAGQNTVIHAVLNGVAVTAGVTLQSKYAPMGAPFTTNVVVTARDADGAAIIGPGNYDKPITLTDSDTTGATHLSATTVNSPSDVVTLSYDGVGFVNPVIAANTGTPQTNPVTARLIPLLQAQELTIPSGSMTRYGMAVGADGAAYFAELRGIGRVTPAGVITEFPFTDSRMGPGSMVLGPDGKVWFDGGINNAPPPIGPANNSYVASITSTGAITQYPVGNAYPLGGLTVGPDNNLWFTYINYSIGSATTGGSTTSYSPTYGNSLNIRANDIVTGSDGNLWMSSDQGALYKYVISTGTVTVYPTPPLFPGAAPGSTIPLRILVGADNLFYLSSGSQVVKMNTSGATVATYPFNNVAGTNGQMLSAYGAVWAPLGVNTDGRPMLAHITTGGAYAEVALPVTASPADQNAPVGALVLGSDGKIWYSRENFVGSFTTH
jgi:virginiamycin B lyase